jgi:lipopolysaccharide assembly outer membrane protein LptD (OstA)
MTRITGHHTRPAANAWPLLLFVALLAAPAAAHDIPPDSATGAAAMAVPVTDTIGMNRDSLDGGGPNAPQDSSAARPDTAAPAWELREDRPDRSAIRYRADVIDYLVEQNLIRLEGNAQVGYQDITINADSIDFFTRDQLMVVRSRPVLHDKDDAITGDRMVYDFKARRGWIYNGSTKFANGRYWGSRIRQVGERTLNVDYGRFTTCDSDTPHFYFWSRRMKIYLGDKIVAEPVALCFSGIPVLVIPFYFFPLSHARHSGFLIPRVGSNNYQGVFLRNLAYYQVLGDQADVTLSADLYEQVGWQGIVEGRWWRQPQFSFNSRYSYLQETDPFKRRWSFWFDHNQALGKRTRLSGSGNFVSDKSYYNDYSENRTTRMEQDLRSYLALNHAWTSASVNLVADYNQNLVTRTKNTRLPEATFDLYGKDFLGKRLQTSGRSYFASFLNSDTLRTDRHQVWDNQVNLSSGLTLLKYLSVSPNAHVVATWYDRDTAGVRNPVRYFYSGGVSAGTTLYGLLPLNLGPLVAFRHQLQPSLSYSYAPKIDQGRFYQVGSAGSYGQYRSLGASLGNTFSVKYRWGAKTRKADLLTWRASSGLDLLQQPRRWAALSSSFSILPGNSLFDCYVSSSYDWYKRMTQYTSLSLGFRRNGSWLGEPQPDSLKPGAVDSSGSARRASPGDTANAVTAGLAPDSMRSIPDTATSLSGTLRQSSDSTGPAGAGKPETAGRKKKGGLPWSYALSFDQNWYRGQGVAGSGIRGNFDLQLTKNWKITYNQYYDLKRKEIVSRDYSIHRDLHCWEASFTSTKSGVYWSYEFRVNLKKIPELKLNIPKTGQVRYE